MSGQRNRLWVVLFLAVLLGIWIAGCGSGSIIINPPPDGGGFRNELFLGGLNVPVTLAFAPDGRLFYNELETGRVRIIQNGLLVPQPFIDLAVDTSGERGLLGLALHPNFATNGFVYVLYSDPVGVHRVLRFTEVNGVGTNQTVIVDNLPSNSVHNGGNIRFGPDGRLYITTGDSGDPANSQDQNSRAGKILRYNDNGSIPGDNPFGAGNPAFNLGLRNSFDFTFHPTSGTIYASENGPACDDEINRIVAGANYGWRPGQPCGDTNATFVAPLVVFNPTIAPTGITFYTSGVLSAFQGNLFMVDFNEGRVRRFVVNDSAPGQITQPIVVVNGGFGPLFDIVQGPDGFLYFSTSDSIRRIVPD
ncbi:MAG: PQQ-dependent sugar dehydrogenase [Terriglobales bacterium]